jgi:asparagine synthase (glutamine-hydrolysing)
VPGLLGLVDGGARRHVGPCFDAMFRVMARGGRLLSEARVSGDGQWALGRVHLGVLQPDPQPADAGPVHVLFHGDLSNQADLATELDERGTHAAGSAAATIAALYRHRGADIARHLKGSFFAVILDEERHSLLLIADRLGSYPVYWFHEGHQLTFASELRAALRVHPSPALNPRAVADLFKFGFPMGDKTLAAGVEMVPAGSTLCYDLQTDTIRITRHDASLEDSFQPSGVSQTKYFEQLRESFDGTMKRATAGRHRYGISLSGGLDTRVLISALDRMDCRVSSFTLGGRGCADEVIADQLARMARTKHKFVALDDQYLDDLLPTVERMVSLTDGMYVSHGFTEMLALRGFEESDCSVLLRGHAGELAKASTAWPLHTDETVFKLTSREQLIDYLLSRLTHVAVTDRTREVLTDSCLESLNGEGPRESLETTLSGVNLAPADLCSYLYLKEYHRRVTVPSLEIFRNVTEVRLPLADVDFLDTVLQAPARWRDGFQIHQTLIAAGNPAYLRVRNPNTGAPAGAGPWTEFVLDKMNTVLRRLNVYGYRHYHSFDGWMRRAFLALVDRVLLEPATIDRGVFRESTVRRFVSEANSGSAEHDDLLQAMVTVELWQRENFAWVQN